MEAQLQWQNGSPPESMEGTWLVHLESQMEGGRVHVMRRAKVSNGFLATIGSYFAFDCPKVIKWAEFNLPE